MSYRFRIRDLSWLDFNARVLQEAEDETVPLFERIKFLAIYSNNLDEFFRVRVAGLHGLELLDKKERAHLPFDPKELIEKIIRRVNEQQQIFGKIYRNQIKPDLDGHGVHLLDETQLTDYLQTWVRKLYFDKIRPHVHPVMLRHADAPYFLTNRSIHLVTELTDPSDRSQRHLAKLELPTSVVSRFYVLPQTSPEEYNIMILDDVIRLNIPLIYPDWITGETYSIKMTRSGELDWGDEAEGDLINKIRHSLKSRSINPPTRFLYDFRMPEGWVDHLAHFFDIPRHECVQGGRYHNFSDFFNFPNPGHKRLNYVSLRPLAHPVLEGPGTIMQLMRRHGDQLLHAPYQRFDYFVRWMEEAVVDPNVTAIYITLYRVADDSRIVHALLRAHRAGKRVVCFFEVKARFDEESNLFWAGEMERAGAQVYYSLPGLKVHTKVAMVERNEDGDTVRYGYLGTGNFNEKTARVYSDIGLFTMDLRMCDEIRQIFRFLSTQQKHRYEELLVAPDHMRPRINQMIDDQVALAQQGKKAYILLKMNSLEDEDMIVRLYRAAEAGVQIDLIIRGICCLDPSIPSLEGRIRAISIIDRFLEHTRVFVFGHGPNPLIYLSSADLMHRNLNKRVECAFPIKNPALKKEILDLMRIQLTDNVKARVLDGTGQNAYVYKPADARTIRAQLKTYAYLRKKLKDAGRHRPA